MVCRPGGRSTRIYEPVEIDPTDLPSILISGEWCRRYCGGNYLIALSGNIQRIALCGEVKRLSERSVQRAPSIDLP
jgi:hypothetical protein